jgi:hypothetical protein
MVISGIPHRVVCGVAETRSQLVLVVDRDSQVSDAAGMLPVVVPILLERPNSFEGDSDPFPIVPPPSC